MSKNQLIEKTLLVIDEKKKQPIFMRSELRVPWKISQSSNLRTDTNSSPVNS
jgi:hypothetical protein